MRFLEDWVEIAIEDFSKETESELTIRKKITTGKSGAFVALVDCKGKQKYDGLFYLKVVHKPSPKYATETELHERAIKMRAFSGKVPEIIYNKLTEKYSILLLQIAGGSWVNLRPFMQTINLYYNGYVELSNLLYVNDLTFQNSLNSSGLLRKILSYKLDEDQGGRILLNAERYILHDIMTHSHIGYSDRNFVNPFYYFFNCDSVKHQEIRPLCGPIHGDCHADNIFCRVKPDASISDVWLIDLSFFEEDNIFFYDLAYFELSTLLRKFDGVGEERWLRLLDYILSYNEDTSKQTIILDQNERGWAEDIILSRLYLNELIEKKHPNRQDDLYFQVILCNIAAGLSFLNKKKREKESTGGLSEGQYRLAFLWACLHLENFMKKSSCGIPNNPKSIPNLNFQNPDIKQNIEKKWAEFEIFHKNGFNILILSQNRESNEIVNELPLSIWNLVIDLNHKRIENNVLENSKRSYTQAWVLGTIPDLRLMNKGGLWYFANGREDISESPVIKDPKKWRRRYHGYLTTLLNDIADQLSPPIINVLFLGNELDQSYVRLVAESIDSAFESGLNQIIIASGNYIEPPDLVQTKSIDINIAIELLNQTKQPDSEDFHDFPTIPIRENRNIKYGKIPKDLIGRVEKDLTIIHNLKAREIDKSRRFGTDFLRGMTIDWSELDKNIDVRRERYEKYYLSEIEVGLKKSTLARVNLLHEPSAGGSTLGRRLAWSFIDMYPVIFLDQLSEQTHTYIRDIFQFTSLPILILAESENITDSDLQLLINKLWEDNVRAVFLWIARVYGNQSDDKILKNIIDDKEALHFQNIFLQEVDEDDFLRRERLKELTTNNSLINQRNLFFYGLTAFDRNYLGLEKLMNQTVRVIDRKQKDLLSCLSLASLYSSEGFPADEFKEIEEKLGIDFENLGFDSLFISRTKNYIKISHKLVAEKYIEKFSRNSDNWRADLHLYVDQFFNTIKNLKNINSERIRRLIKILFVTRDVEAVIRSDIDSVVSNTHRRFSPLIQDLGNTETARNTLSKIRNLWPDEHHFSIHYARHLLYESPEKYDDALKIALSIDNDAKDPIVFHTIGMCYRAKMVQKLDAAKETKSCIDTIIEPVRHDFEKATENFFKSIEHANSDEYGLVATVQTVSIFLRSLIMITNTNNLAIFLKNHKNNLYLDALHLGDDCVNQLESNTRKKLSVRTVTVCAQWKTIYGNYDSVLNELNNISKKYEDP